MERVIAWLLVLASVLAGCGSSKKDEGCPEGTATGATVACSCGDGGPGGMQTCRDDGTLSDCDCGTGSGTGGTPGTGGSTSSGTGGSTSSGTGGSTSSGTGGTTPATGGMGAEPSGDAGPAPMDAGAPSGTGGTTMAPPPPMDGNQGALCTSGVDCNMGLDCYTTGGGLDFCTAVCDAPEDCAGIAGAMYTCSMSTGLCQVVCMGTDDTMSCPAGMVCLDSGGGGGGTPFRCKYPMSAAGLQGFDECADDMDCGDGLGCVGTIVPGGSGFCSTPCMAEADCADLGAPSSTMITPSCEPTGPGPMTTGCVLNCAAAPTGCPDGMECASLGPLQRCIYP